MNSSTAASLLLLTLVCTGCAAKKNLPVPPAQLAAAEQNRRGVKAAALGDEEAALAHFMEARRMSAALEDQEGVALALLNAARVLRFANRTTQARDLLETALPLVPPHHSSFAEFAFERARLAVTQGDLALAQLWAEKAVAAERGDLLKKRLNLLARIEYLRAEYQQAQRTVEKAGEIEGSSQEMANSRRIAGDILSATGRFTLARKAYLDALSLDKSLGNSRKIAADLAALARVSAALDQPLEAVAYHRRASEVHLALGDRLRAAAELKNAARLLEAIGKKQDGLQALKQSESYLKEDPRGESVSKGGTLPGPREAGSDSLLGPPPKEAP